MRHRLAFAPVDIVAIAINTFLGIMHLAFPTSEGNILLGVAFLAANGLVLGFAAADGRGLIRKGTFLHFVRVFYVQAFYAPYFMRVIVLSQLVWDGASFDSLFYNMEEAIFGAQLAIVLPQRFGHLRVINEIFYFGYFAFYPLLCAPGWILFFRRRYREAESALFTITASFGILYVWYVFFPVQGPKYYVDVLYERWYSDLDGYLFAWIMRTVFADANLAGAAIPSSHVAISTIATILFGRHLPRALWLVVPITVILFISTTYLYAHYAVDALLGLAVVPLLLWWSRWLLRALRQCADPETRRAATSS